MFYGFFHRCGFFFRGLFAAFGGRSLSTPFPSVPPLPSSHAAPHCSGVPSSISYRLASQSSTMQHRYFGPGPKVCGVFLLLSFPRSFRASGIPYLCVDSQNGTFGGVYEAALLPCRVCATKAKLGSGQVVHSWACLNRERSKTKHKRLGPRNTRVSIVSCAT